MSIELNIDEGAGRARVDGEMTIYTVADHREKWLEHCRQLASDNTPWLNLDLSGVTEMDAAGLQLLVALEKHLVEAEGGLRLEQRSECVQQTLDQSQLGAHFVHPDNRSEP